MVQPNVTPHPGMPNPPKENQQLDTVKDTEVNPDKDRNKKDLGKDFEKPFPKKEPSKQ